MINRPGPLHLAAPAREGVGAQKSAGERSAHNPREIFLILRWSGSPGLDRTARREARLFTLALEA